MTAGKDQPERGIAARFVDGLDFIIQSTWDEAAQRKQPVGTCRRAACGGLMMARPAYRNDNILWFEAECDNCGSSIATPDGRVLRRSTRHAEMPGGWWANRTDVLKKVRDMVAGGDPS